MREGILGIEKETYFSFYFDSFETSTELHNVL